MQIVEVLRHSFDVQKPLQTSFSVNYQIKRESVTEEQSDIQIQPQPTIRNTFTFNYIKIKLQIDKNVIQSLNQNLSLLQMQTERLELNVKNLFRNQFVLEKQMK
ncbi:Hypothetical_protein [Hexamita inflata]|uniref:Hypothetical_protein n=1 Tax=Hexamita inflata TaxID=28002 RepID=A0AA86QH49_9EUKA|nr:Hypothetical protein HINF_LOCUS42158 [Hexamita inflata]